MLPLYYTTVRYLKQNEECFHFLIFFLLCTTVLCQGISPMGNSDYLSWGKPAATESCYSTYNKCWVFKCFHNPPNSDMDYGIFNVRTDVNPCNCPRGRTDTVRESVLKVDSGRKSPCRTRESNLRPRRASPMLYQLSYILSPVPVYFIEYFF